MTKRKTETVVITTCFDTVNSLMSLLGLVMRLPSTLQVLVDQEHIRKKEMIDVSQIRDG